MNGQRLYLDVQFLRAQIGQLRHDWPELADDAQLLEDTIEGETNLDEVLTKLVRLQRHAGAVAQAIESQIGALAERAARYEQQKSTYRTMIHRLMDAAGQKKRELPEATISISKAKPGCIVTDESLLPEEFVKTTRTPKKTEILAALSAGERVPGAEKSNGSTYLTIRT